MSTIKFYIAPASSSQESAVNSISLPKSQWGALPDAQLTSLYKDGEDYAAALLYVRYNDLAHKAVVAKVKDRDVAKDIAQDAFIAVLDSVKNGAYAENSRFRNYVGFVARNKALDYFKAASVKNSVQTDFDNPDGASFASNLVDDDPEVLAEREERLNLIEKNIKLLSEDLRTVFLMRMQDVSFKEIAEELSISINTAISRYQYAVKNLRKMCLAAEKVA